MAEPESYEDYRRRSMAYSPEDQIALAEAQMAQVARERAFAEQQPLQDYKRDVTVARSPQDVQAAASAAALAGQPPPDAVAPPPPAGAAPSLASSITPQDPATLPNSTPEMVAMGKQGFPRAPQQQAMGGGGPPRSPWVDVLKPEARKAMEQSMAGERQAIGMRQALGERTATEDSEMAGRNEAMLEDAAQRFAKQKDAQAAQARLVEEKYANAVDALDHEQLDNDRWWNKKTTGQKIGTTIGALLMGLGSGMARDQNSNAGVDMLNKQMSDDLHQQRDAYHRKGKKAEGLQSLYAQMFKRFGDEDQAMNAAMALGTRKLGAQVQKMAAARGTDEAKARAQEMLAKLGMQEGQFIANSYAKPVMGGGGGSKKEDEYYKHKIFEHKLKMLELGGERGAKRGEKADEAVLEMSKRLGAADIEQTLSMLSRAKGEISSNDAGTSLPARALYGSGPLGRSIYGKVFDEKSVKREGDYSEVTSQAMKAMSGLGFSIPEMAENKARMEGAGTPTSRLGAIERIQENIQAKADSIKAANPEAYESYMQNLRQIQGRVPSARGGK